MTERIETTTGLRRVALVRSGSEAQGSGGAGEQGGRNAGEPGSRGAGEGALDLSLVTPHSSTAQGWLGALQTAAATAVIRCLLYTSRCV